MINNSIVIRLGLAKKGRLLSDVLAAISDLDAQIGAIDIVKAEGDTVIRDITIDTYGEDHAAQVVQTLKALAGVEVKYVSDRTFLVHLGGKIEVKSKIPIRNRDDLSLTYTPGVGRVSMAIYHDPDKARNLTIKHNAVAVITDGTAVLGLGDIGPLAALPVMEGKAMLMKEFANIDAFPLCLDTKDVDELVRTIKNVAPVFGAINLEDISAPRCFEVEKRLKAELDIPVFHDDQHGTAAVMTAALLNALKIVGKDLKEIKVVINGVGAAGTACTYMLLKLGVKNIIGCDRKGALVTTRTDLNSTKQEYAGLTNPNNESGSLYEVIKDADVFVGLSSADVLKAEDLKKMRKDPIVFAMANPIPEIMPEVAAPHVAIMATGRSDYPNQINNLLAFPGILRGALDSQARDINEEMCLAAAFAIANSIDEASLSPDYIVPSVFNRHVAEAVTAAVIEAAHKTNVARK